MDYPNPQKNVSSAYKPFIEAPLISVITVVYNGEEYLERSMLSVINQDYQNIEYILVDGGSTDKTIDFIKKYEHKIDHWLSEKDEGIYDAMNKGIKLSKGDYVIFLNSDDYFLENVLSKAALLLAGNVDGVCGGINFTDKNDQVLYSQYTSADDMFSYVMHQGFLYRRSLHDSLGLYNITYKVNADYDFYKKSLLNNVKFAYCDIIFANMLAGGFSNKNKLLSAVETLHIQLKYNLPASKSFLIFFVKLTKIRVSNLMEVLYLDALIKLYRKAVK